MTQVLIGGARLLYSIPAGVLLALAALVSLWPQARASHATRTGCVWATALFCLYLAVRDWLSPVDYLARPDFLILAGSLVIYLLVAVFLERSKFRLWLFFAMLGMAVCHAAVGAVQFKRGDQFMLLPWIHRTDDWWRASGFYISPNHFAGLVEVMALMSLSVVVWSDLKTSSKIVIGYLGVCCLMGLALSGSRGGYLSFSLGLLAFAALSMAAYRLGRHGRLAPTLFAGLGVLILLGVAGWLLMGQSGVLKARVAAIHDPENMRWFLWRAALEQFRLQPLWGTGSGTFLYYGRMFRAANVQNDPIYAHNDYLHLLAEYGVAGAARFLLFFSYACFCGCSKHCASRGRTPLALDHPRKPARPADRRDERRRRLHVSLGGRFQSAHPRQRVSHGVDVRHDRKSGDQHRRRLAAADRCPFLRATPPRRHRDRPGRFQYPEIPR